MRQRQATIPIIGNQRAVEFSRRLLGLIDSGVVINGSYILAGPNHLGKRTLLRWWLQGLVCSAADRPCLRCQPCQQIASGVWPDLQELRLEAGKKNISVEQARGLIMRLKLSSFLNNYKFGVIYGADDLSESAANALLKLLEEPNQKVLIWLVCRSLERLPQTIVSRSSVVRFYPVATDLIYNYLVEVKKIGRGAAKNLAALSGGAPGKAIALAEAEDDYQALLAGAKEFIEVISQDLNTRLHLMADNNAAEAQTLVEQWQAVTRDLILCYYQQVDLVRHQALLDELQALAIKISLSRILSWQELLTRARQYLRANVNPRLSLESALINML